MSGLSLRKASRQKTKIRVGISGPSGSGKTYSALLMASGMAHWDKIALIDTENGSGDLYAHLGPYSVITLTAPFTPERYIEALKACEAAGMAIVVIDSTSHEWDGKGGCLESNDLLAQTKFKGNSWAAWSVTTPRHQRFIEAILTSPCHIITTARSKTDTIQTDDKKVKKVGTKEIQREGFEYELTLNFNLDRDTHYATASKDRTELFEGKDPCIITSEIGKRILEWTIQGADVTATQRDLVQPAASTAIPDVPPPQKQPTFTKVLESLTDCKDLARLAAVHHRAMSFQWSPEDRNGIEECNAHMLKRLSSPTEADIESAEKAAQQAA